MCIIVASTVSFNSINNTYYGLFNTRTEATRYGKKKLNIFIWDVWHFNRKFQVITLLKN